MVESFLIKLQFFNLQVFQKETPTQAFSCETCKTFKNKEHLQTTASGGVLNCFVIFKERK